MRYLEVYKYGDISKGAIFQGDRGIRILISYTGAPLLLDYVQKIKVNCSKSQSKFEDLSRVRGSKFWSLAAYCCLRRR